MVLAQILRPKLELGSLLWFKMAVVVFVGPPKYPDDKQCTEDKVDSSYRVGNEWIESVFSKVLGVIEGITLLAPCRES